MRCSHYNEAAGSRDRARPVVRQNLELRLSLLKMDNVQSLSAEAFPKSKTFSIAYS